MAKNSDVLLRIGADVDKTFKASIQEIIAGMKNIKKASTTINSFGTKKDELRESFTETRKTLDDINTRIRDTKNLIQDLNSQKLNFATTKSWKDFVNPEKQKKLDIDKEALNFQINQASLKNTVSMKNKPERDNISNLVKEQKTKLEELTKSYENLVNIQIKLKTELKEFQSSIGERLTSTSLQNVDDEFNNICEVLNVINSNIRKNEPSLKDYENSILQTSKLLKELEDKQVQLSNDKTLTPGSTLDKKAKNIDVRQEKIYAEAQQKYNEALGETATKINNAEKELNKLYSTQSRLNREEDIMADKIRTTYDNAISVFSRAAVAINQSLLNTIGGAIKTVGKWVEKLGVKLLKTVGKMSGLWSETTSKALSLAKVIRLIVQYGFGFRSLYYLIRRFRSGIAEGFEYLGGAVKSAKKTISGASEEIGKLLTTLKELLLYLKAAAAAMLAPFAPLINKVIPELIDLFNRLSTVVATFVATLTGTGTNVSIIKATTDLDKYANALDQTSSSAKDAKKSLAAFDDINVLDKDTSSSGSSTTTIDTSDWFTTENVEPSNLALLMKEAWQKADFTAVGDVIGTRLKETLDGIKWDTIFGNIEKVAKSIATFINGAVTVATENLDGITTTLGTALGTAFANVLNGISTFILKFVQELHWKDVGKFIGDGIVGFLTTLDMSQYGQAIHDFASNMMLMLSTALSTLSDSEVGVGDKIGEFFASLQLTDLGTKFINLAKQIAGGIKDALADWAETDPDSFGLVKALGIAIVSTKVVGSILGSAISVLSNTIVEELAKNLAKNLLSKYFTDTVALTTGETLLLTTTAETPILSTISGTIQSLASSCSAALSAISPVILAITALVAILVTAYTTNEEFRNTVNELVSTVLTGLVTLWTDHLQPALSELWDLLTLIWDEILVPFVGWFANSFISPCIKALTTLLDASFEVFGGVVSAIGDIILALKGVIEFLIGVFTGDWEKIWQGIKDIFGGIWNGLLDIVSGIINGIIVCINKVMSAIDELTTFSADIPLFGHVELGGLFNGYQIPAFTALDSYKYVPKLAQGAVIPPNKEFLAMLGDQKSGTNIEAPLDTIVQAMQQALVGSGLGNQEIVMNIDGKTFARLTVSNTLDELHRRGYNVKVLNY